MIVAFKKITLKIQNSSVREAHAFTTEMIIVLWLVVALSVIVHWFYRVNKEYYVLAFFARRVKAKEGKSLEDLAPIATPRFFCGNSFDLYGKNPGKPFKDLKLQIIII